MKLSHNTELDSQLRWVDTLSNHHGLAGIAPSCTELNVRLGWQPVKNNALSHIEQNLVHDQHVEYGFPTEARVTSNVVSVRWAF